MKKFGFFATVSAAAALLGGVAAAQSPTMTPAGVPQNAEAGQCFARVLIPEVIETASEEVVVEAARTEVRKIPAQYELVDETVLVKEATTEYTVIPATYRTVTETVVLEPERTEMIAQPASMETYTERVMIRPGYTTWKQGSGIFGRSGVGASAAVVPGAVNGVDQHTGDLLCKVEVPPEYATVTRQRVAQAASATPRIIPARTQTVTKQVIATPARVAERQIPAVYNTVKVRKMVTPEREETRTIPAVTRTEQRRKVVRPASVEWREVLCETNASTVKISEVQRALAGRGYANPADGRFGPATLSAMEKFQRDNGLAVGYLTIETVRALGVSPR